MALQTIFYNRDFSARIQPPLFLEVNNFSWHVLGGCKAASISASSGDEKALPLLFDMLRCPVEILNEQGIARWWGFVESVEVRIGGIAISLSLETMFNKVAMVFSRVTPGSGSSGQRSTTAYASDADSIAEYGTKESRISMTNASETDAQLRRDLILSELRNPIGGIGFTGAEAEGSFSATIRAKGWYSTLGWQYYAQASGVEEFTQGDEVDAVFGRNYAQYLAQSFSLPSGDSWRLTTISIMLSKQGEPTENVIVALYSNNAGVPGTLLASAPAMSATLINTNSQWFNFTLTTPYTLAASTTYFIHVSSSAVSENPADNFSVKLYRAGGYPRGEMLRYDNEVPGWSNLHFTGSGQPLGDMCFRLVGDRETTQQIVDIETACGQFITGVDILDASGVYSPHYRAGDTLALKETEAILERGTSAGKRLLANVTRERRLQIYAEPAQSVVTYMLRNGSFVDMVGAPVAADNAVAGVGKWTGTKDIALPSSATSRLTGVQPFFVEEWEYSASSSIPRIRPKSAPSPFDLAKAVNR